MMGYNEGGDFNMTDSCNGRKLRPLMPRVPHAPTANPTNCLRNFHGENFIALNHHQLGKLIFIHRHVFLLFLFFAFPFLYCMRDTDTSSYIENSILSTDLNIFNFFFCIQL